MPALGMLHTTLVAWSCATVVTPGSKLLLYSDGIFELARPDGEMATLDDFVASVPPLVARADALDAMLARARGVQASDSFKDDVSLLQLRFDP